MTGTKDTTAPPQPGPDGADVQKTGYTGFGSFHSDDVEVLIRQDASSYVPPSLPFADPVEQASAQHACSTAGSGNAASSASNSSGTSAHWGLERCGEFLIDFDRWTFINHGAFGGVSRYATGPLGQGLPCLALFMDLSRSASPAAVTDSASGWLLQCQGRAANYQTPAKTQTSRPILSQRLSVELVVLLPLSSSYAC